MTNKYIQPGKVIDHTAGSAISTGDAVVIGVLLGVALGNIALADTGSVQIEGVFELPKLSSYAVADGELLTWDVSAGEFSNGVAATGDLVGCAVAIEAAEAGATTVLAKLLPGNAAVTA